MLTGVWNRTAEKAKALADELKVHAFANLTELAGNCEAVVTCVSADKDFGQLIEIHDEQWDFSRDQRWDTRGVRQRLGVQPEQVADLNKVFGLSLPEHKH